MFTAPRADLVANTAAYENEPLVKATGFREYDARWLFGPEINLLGVQALGLGLGTYIHELGQSKIVVGHDFRSYSTSIKNALILGLISAGCEVHDIGLALSPTAYFAQFDLDIPCVAMVTASHNENGWTGVKMGAQKPLTFGPDEMSRLKAIVLGAQFVERDGGKLIRVQGEAQRYIDDVAKRASHPSPEGHRRLRQRHGRRLRGRGPPEDGRGRGRADGYRPRLQFPQVQSQSRRRRDATRDGPRRP